MPLESGNQMILSHDIDVKLFLNLKPFKNWKISIKYHQGLWIIFNLYLMVLKFCHIYIFHFDFIFKQHYFSKMKIIFVFITFIFSLFTDRWNTCGWHCCFHIQVHTTLCWTWNFVGKILVQRTGWCGRLYALRNQTSARGYHWQWSP